MPAKNIFSEFKQFCQYIYIIPFALVRTEYLCVHCHAIQCNTMQYHTITYHTGQFDDAVQGPTIALSLEILSREWRFLKESWMVFKRQRRRLKRSC